MNTQLTTIDVARLAHVKPATIYRHRARGTIPNPDGYVGVVPYWYVETVSMWLETRRKKGQRRNVREVA